MARAKRSSKGGAKYGLCVGINDYPGTGSDLEGCVNDAKDWRRFLEHRGYEVAMLLDAKATRANMHQALEALIGKARPGDSLIFTYSGHGSWLPDRSGDEADARDEMLCPHDVSAGQYLLDDDLAEIFGRKPAGVTLYFISDSCHSGTVTRFMPSPVPRSLQKRLPRPRFLPPAAFLKGQSLRAAEHVAAMVRPPKQKYPALLAAGCRDTEYSYDATFPGRPNGAFTYFALRALAKNPGTPTKWMGLIRTSLPSSIHPQTPSLYGSSTLKSGQIF
jgi:metacaspase-1